MSSAFSDSHTIGVFKTNQEKQMTAEEIIFRLNNYLEIYNHRPKNVQVNMSIVPDTVKQLIQVLSDQRHRIKELESALKLTQKEQ